MCVECEERKILEMYSSSVPMVISGIKIGTPHESGYQRLLTKHLDGIRLVEGLSVKLLSERLKGISPADLEAICNSAKRMAMRRMADSAEELPPLVWNDFTEAMKRVQVQ